MRRPPIWCKAFLIALEESNGKKSVAAGLCGVDDREVRRRLKSDASFFQDVEAVYDRLEQALIDKVRRRGNLRRTA